MLAGHGIAPSSDVLATSAYHVDTRRPESIEHLRVHRVNQEIHLVAFIVAEGVDEAGTFAWMLGLAMSQDIRQISFAGFRVWPNNRLTTGEDDIL